MHKVHITADGSATLFMPEINEHYHSVKGAFTESEHIFVNQGFCFNIKPRVLVFEVGMGTGLNALLTYQKANELQCQTIYITIEKYPLNWETISQMGYETLFAGANIALKAIHVAEWGKQVVLSPFFSIHKVKEDLKLLDPQQGIDVVYFDAFSPETQPEMWTAPIFTKLFNAMSEQAVLTTYCSKGAIRRLLQSIGFKVERIPGPPNGKREIIRAVKC